MPGWIDQFPVTTGPLITVPSPPDNSIHSYHVAATEREVPIVARDKDLPNLHWFPFVAIRAKGACIGRAMNGSEVTVDRDLTRVAFYLTRLIPSDGSTLVDVDWQLRASSECTPEVIGRGTIHLQSLQQVGLIVQASGWLCTQFELWFSISSGMVKASIGVDIMAGRSDDGAPRDVFKGSVSI